MQADLLGTTRFRADRRVFTAEFAAEYVRSTFPIRSTRLAGLRWLEQESVRGSRLQTGLSRMTEAIIALIALTLMEIVLGIDNIIFIAIATDKLPEDQQPQARRIGLIAALVMRIGLLLTLSWFMQLVDPVFYLTQIGVPQSWLAGEHFEEINGVSWRDLILLIGGLFLIRKSVSEIHELSTGEEDEEIKASATFGVVLFQIAMYDIIFSLDSIITAIGMVDPEDLWVMVTAVIVAVGVMLLFAESISRFVKRHPSLKMLALSFLILIGVMLVAEAVGTHVEKGYIYFAMAFALGVEGLNLMAGNRKSEGKQPA